MPLLNRKILTGLFLFVAVITVKAQDIQFSQFYATSLYQNPAFAGGAHFDRIITHNRWQWTSLDARYNTTMLSYDKYWGQYHSGFGGYILKDMQGLKDIRSLQMALQYAYELHLNKQFAVRMGLQTEFVQRTTDYSVHTFPSQYDEAVQDFTGINPLADNSSNRYYADFSTGALLYSDDLWVGATIHHLNTPNQTFIKGDAPLPTRYAFTAGYRIRFKQDNDLIFRDHPTAYFIMPTIHYKTQGKNDQFDLGVYGIYDHLLFGAWYRGIPFKKYEDIQNSESMVVCVGWELRGTFDIRYSYDWTLSTLSQPTIRTGGSHELNIALMMHKAFKRNSNQRMKRLPCPDHHIHY